MLLDLWATFPTAKAAMGSEPLERSVAFVGSLSPSDSDRLGGFGKGTGRRLRCHLAIEFGRKEMKRRCTSSTSLESHSQFFQSYPRLQTGTLSLFPLIKSVSFGRVLAGHASNLQNSHWLILVDIPIPQQHLSHRSAPSPKALALLHLVHLVHLVHRWGKPS